MKLLINGIQSNLRFSSAHVIPGHESCGFIHGHSYFVDVEIEGERAGEFDFVVDFKDVKKYTKAICDELDHRLLIPVYNKLIDFKESWHKKAFAGTTALDTIPLTEQTAASALKFILSLNPHPAQGYTTDTSDSGTQIDVVGRCDSCIALHFESGTSVYVYA